MVKAVTIMALQPLASCARVDDINYGVMVQHLNLVEIFFEHPKFMLSYDLVFLVLGIFIGYNLQKAIHKF